MVLEGHAPRVHSSKYSRRPGWGWPRCSMTQEPSRPHERSKGPRLEMEVWVVQLSLKKKACSWLCRPKCIYEVRHLSSAWTFSHVNSLHAHTHSRRLGYFSYVMNGRKKRTQEVQHLIHGQAPFTQKSGKRRPTHPAACPFYRLRALLSHLYPHGNIP